MPLDLSDLRLKPITELVDQGRKVGIDNAGGLRKQELIFEIVRRRASSAGGAVGAGVLETLPDGFGFLRSPDCNYLPGPDDIYVSPSQIRRFNLRTGDEVRGQVRPPKESERYFALIKIEAVNGRSPDRERDKLLFDNLTAVHPSRAMRLEAPASGDAGRLLDLYLPLAFGQRVAVLADPAAGRTRLLAQIGRGVRACHPEAVVLVVLVDERPEEVTGMAAQVDAEVLSSTFDEPAARHIQVAEMAMERARRLVEQGKDVVVLLDSLSRLSRAWHAAGQPGARVIGDALDATALAKTRRVFGAGRALSEGGSLTMIATLLTGTASPADRVLVEELEGTANVDLVLSGLLASDELRPAVDLERSRARDRERYLTEGERAARAALRRSLGDGAAGVLSGALQQLASTADNGALLERLDKPGSVGKKGLSA